MVTGWMTGALLAASVAGPAAGAPHWADAGGSIFVIPRPADAAAAEPQPADLARLPELDQPYAAEIEDAARRHRIDPKLLRALVAVESAHRAQAVSPAGAAGLTQLMPATAAELEVRDRFDPVANLRGGAEYLARQLVRFGDVRLALAAFNAGPERVARLGRVPHIAETQAYVRDVVECYLALSAGRGVRSSLDCRGAVR